MKELERIGKFSKNMVKEDYVSRETYKLLKEKGYDGEFKTCYDMEGYTCPAIHLYDAMKWLREVHNFHITAFPAWDNDDGTKMSFEKWGESIDGLDGEYCMPISGPVYYNSYEEACEAAIKYCLKNLI